MRFAWLPRPYIFLWLLFLSSAALWQLQTRNPERFNLHVILNLGQRSVAILLVLLVAGTLWVLFDSWEQQIMKKPRPRVVELARIDRFYGGTVIVRTLPRKVWDAASEGDRLLKRPGTLFAPLEYRNRDDTRVAVGLPDQPTPE